MTCRRCGERPVRERKSPRGGARPIYCEPCRVEAKLEAGVAKTRRYGERHPEKVRQWRKERWARERVNPERTEHRNALAKARRQRDPISFQRSGRLARHGLAAAAFDALMAAQRNLCALCDGELPTDPHEQRARREPQVDHDHVTGQIRGLLCRVCNTRLGVIERVTDEWLARADLYRHRVPELARDAATRMQEALG